MTRPANRAPDSPVRQVAIAGASGFLGSALVRELQGDGFDVRHLKRRAPVAGSDIRWNPERGELDPRSLEGVDAIVNLAGEPIAQRWTDAKKAAIRDSRLKSTTLLAQAVARLERPPILFLSGSAIGIYGDRGDEELDEGSAPGAGFLAETATAWEHAAESVSGPSTRLIFLRTGIVLNPAGGALAKMLLPYKLGLGGRIGSGKQWMSWISLADWVCAVIFMLRSHKVEGAVNLVAPSPVPSADFSKTLARVLERPTLGIVPAIVVELLFGEMGRETLLASQRIHPRRLLDAGFEFAHPTLEQALRAELT